jgi:hypothetical protein
MDVGTMSYLVGQGFRLSTPLEGTAPPVGVQTKVVQLPKLLAMRHGNVLELLARDDAASAPGLVSAHARPFPGSPIQLGMRDIFRVEARLSSSSIFLRDVTQGGEVLTMDPSGVSEPTVTTRYHRDPWFLNAARQKGLLVRAEAERQVVVYAILAFGNDELPRHRS